MPLEQFHNIIYSFLNVKIGLNNNKKRNVMILIKKKNMRISNAIESVKGSIQQFVAINAEQVTSMVFKMKAY